MTAVVGTRMLRKEDPTLLTGEDKFIDDIQVPGQLWMGMIRSPMAHAKINSIDTSAAESMPGVYAVYTGQQLQDMGVTGGPLPCAWPVTDDMVSLPHFPVAVGEAKFVGDPVCIVLADSRYQAVDAAEQVVVDYESLPAVASIEAAVEGSAMANSELASNKSFRWPLVPDQDALDAAFAAATHVVKGRFVQQRLIPSAMEPRGCLAVPAPTGGEITLYVSSQIPHFYKFFIAAVVGIPENKIRVVAPSVGGGFGGKINIDGDAMLATALASSLGRPVRWTEERTEAAASTHHGRGQIQYVEIAADADGKATAVRAHVDADMGAYMTLLSPGIPTLGAWLYTGVYDIPHIGVTIDGYFTNLPPTDAYRGAGRPEASYAIERIMDMLADEVGITPEEIRRRNYINGGEHYENYESAGSLIFDSGHYNPAHDKAMALADVEALRAEQARRRDAGESKQLGIGMCTYMELCGWAPSRTLGALKYAAGGWETATVRMLATGKVEVVTGTSPHGQGHETAWSMIVADKLGVDVNDIEVLHSDTAIAPLGLDTYGSRSLPVGGEAISKAADKVIEKARLIAAHQFEAAPEDVEFLDGSFSVSGSPSKSVHIQELAFPAFSAHDLPDGLEPNLTEGFTYDPPNLVYPFGTHVAVVEIDVDTGGIDLIDYIAVDDCGPQINPMIVEGQIHGGIVQGATQALWEEACYDDDGNPLNPSFMDYLVPSAAEVPSMRIDNTVTPSTTNSMGVKGAGEAGSIGSAAAVMNAVCDALKPYGVTDMDMPATPKRIWEVINSNGGAA